MRPVKVSDKANVTATDLSPGALCFVLGCILGCWILATPADVTEDHFALKPDAKGSPVLTSRTQSNQCVALAREWMSRHPGDVIEWTGTHSHNHLASFSADGSKGLAVRDLNFH